MAGTGNGTVIVYGAGPIARIQSLGALTESLQVLDDSDLDTTGHMDYCVSDIIEHNGMEIEFRADDLADWELIDGTSNLTTVTFPLASGQNGAANFSGQASVSQRMTPTFTNAELITGSVTVQFLGDITFANAT